MSTPERTRPRLGGWVRRILIGVILIGALVTGGTAVRVWQTARLDDRSRADVIVVLGAAQYNGRPSEIFRARLAHAKELYDEGVAGTVVTSGGSKAGDAYTEAEAGVRWLAEHGVPREHTLPVGEGNDTQRSLEAVSTAVHDRGWNTAVLVSDPWHSLRARTMAEDAGLDVWTSPTHSGPIVQTRETQAKYIFRETGALMFYRLSRDPADAFGNNGLG